MNYHIEGDRLERICRDELLQRWPNSKIIETKTDSVHGIDFAIEIIGNGIAIIEVKRERKQREFKERLQQNISMTQDSISRMQDSIYRDQEVLQDKRGKLYTISDKYKDNLRESISRLEDKIFSKDEKMKK